MNSRILLIEDDTILGDILANKLKSEGYEVTLATDGAVGLEAMRKEKPSLILLDIMLPTMNGYEILEAKNGDPALKDIPVIVISNSGQPVELERTLALGVRDYFIKAQFDPNEVLEKVRLVLPPASGPEASLSEKYLLLVEDDRLLSDVMQKKLSDKGAEVRHVTSGEDALSALSQTGDGAKKPHLILLDLILPGMQGFDVLQKIKEDPANAGIPIIILSNLSQKEDMEKAKGLGASNFLVKAMSTPDDIYRMVASTLESSQPH